MQERLGCPSRTAHCCPLATEEVDESGEVLLLPLLSEPVSSGRKKQRIYHPALLRGKERCSHHLLKSCPNHLRVARPRASCSWLCRPSWQGPGRAGDPAYDWLHGATWVEAVAPARERGQSQGVTLGDEQAEVLPAAECMQQRTAGAGCGVSIATPRWSSSHNGYMTHPQTLPQRALSPDTRCSARDHLSAPGNDCIQKHTSRMSSLKRRKLYLCKLF